MSKAKHKPKAGRHWRRTITVIAILMVLVGIYGIYRRAMSNQVQAKLDAIRAAGYPATLAELNDSYAYPPPGQSNAADIYLKAVAALQLPGDVNDLPIIGQGDWPALNEPLPSDTTETLRNLLIADETTLKLLHEVAEIPHARYPTRISIVGTNDACGALRRCAGLLCVGALLEAEQQHTDEVDRNLRAAMAVGRSLRNEPLTVSQLVGHSIQYITATTMERVLNRASVTQDQIRQWQTWLERADSPVGMRRAIAGERCILSDVYHRNFSGVPGGRATSGWSFFLDMIGMIDADHLVTLDTMTRMVEALEKPSHLALSDLASLDAEVAALPRYRATHLKIMYPALLRACEIHAGGLAYFRAARMALAAERYRKTHGRLPNALGDVAPDFIETVPLDPFDGQPLRYRKLDTGFMVYSVGKDGADNGGVQTDAAGQKFGPGTDITFTIAR